MKKEIIIHTAASATNVDQYIASFPETTQTRLKAIRSLIQTTVPEAEESISYGIPTYKLHKKALIYFGGYESAPDRGGLERAG